MTQQRLIAGRLNKSRERLMAAKTLLQAKFYSDALSRSYYAIFFAAKAVLAIKGSEPKRHGGVVSEFNLHFVKTKIVEQEMGAILAQARVKRELGDYDDFYEATRTEAERQLHRAESFVKRMEKLVEDSSSPEASLEFKVKEREDSYSRRPGRRKGDSKKKKIRRGPFS